MAKKKKKTKKQSAGWALSQEVTDEIIALAAIYGEDFELDEDSHGYTVRIVPHPGDFEPNLCAVKLHIR
jgi:hypothetical protein